ncbi:four-helix bundle copper-binding protein [Anaerobacillus sp. MEB173]|uniref:four-helix bundle copper-binding protein n=1 Tax=Anaerobacillus sp. MEB173 TaxID=3383345 RepID=UPI003F8DD97B
MPDAGHRKEQLRLLRDCADICTLTAKFVSRCSPFAKSLAALCGQICEICGNHCLHHPDPQSQTCGQICLHCAQECRVFAMGA